MKAIRYDRYGPPEVLELRDIDVPAVGDDEVLVRVRAASGFAVGHTGNHMTGPRRGPVEG